MGVNSAANRNPGENESSVTKIIDQSLKDFFDTFAEKEIEKVLSREDKEELTVFFEKYFAEAPCFGDYIHLYIYQTTDLKDKWEKYTDISPDIYYRDYITPSFKDRLGKIRASLNPDSKETLGTKKEILSGKRQAVRADVFLFAFGLGMDVETVSLILKKCLLEDDFDMKNYQEVIYYWCLKHHLPYRVMVAWMQYYKDMDPKKEKMEKSVNPIGNKDTLILSHRVKRGLRGEKEFIAYLLSLKLSAEDELMKKSGKKAFKELFRSFPRALEGEDNFDPAGKSEKEIWNEDRMYSMNLNVETRIQVLKRIRKSSFEKNEEELLSDDVLRSVFKDLSYTKKSINNRLYGTTPVSRKELLTAEFIVYMIGILDDEKEEHRFQTGSDRITFRTREASWIDFSEIASNTLKDVGMQGFYVRNPFDLFLVYCILHKDPFAYFMASWEKGERAWTIEKH